MAQIKRGDPHGLQAVQVALVGTDGFAYGVAGPTMAAGSTSGAYLVDTPISATLPNPDRNTIHFLGGNRWQGAYQYGISAVNPFDFVISGYDADLIALVSGGVADQTTNTLWTYFSENELIDAAPQCMMMLTYKLQGRGGDTDGADVYITTIIPRCWITPRGPTGAPAFQAKGEYSFAVQPTASKVLPHGLLLEDTAMDLQDDKAFRIHVISDYPLGFAAHIGADPGGSTSFTLPYLPVSTTTTVNASDNELAIDGTLTAATTVDTATGEVTVSVAANKNAGMLYGTRFVPSA